MEKRRNVLFIIADQFRWDALGAAGNTVVQTPNLDMLAAEGVLFDQCFVQTAPCGPSRACIYTGRYACSHRSVQNMTPLVDAHECLPVHLSRAGYRPAIFGYNDYAVDPRLLPPDDLRAQTLSYENFLPGWHTTYFHEYDSPEYFDYLRGKHYPEHLLVRQAIHQPHVPEGWAGECLPLCFPAHYKAEDSESQFMTSKAIEFLGRQGDHAWFLNVNYIKPHPPRVCPAPYHAMYADMPVRPVMRRPSELVSDHAYMRYMHRKPQLESDKDLRDTQANYYGMISELDSGLGRLFQHLKEAGEWDSTLIIFTSDHGEYLGDHYLTDKGHFYDSGMRVPLIIRDPLATADATRGQCLDGFCESIDLAPTVLDWLDIPIPDRFQGRSLLPRLREKDERGKNAVFYEYDFRLDCPKDVCAEPDRCLLWVVRDQDYKYVQFADSTMEPLLFDVRNDPGEFEDLSQRAIYAPLVTRYCQALLRWRMTHEDQRMEHWASVRR